MNKSLKDISWNVTEEEYRKDKALSYSTLAKYERGGFKSLESLFDSISTPSLTFGSAVDSIITGGMDEFNSRFIIADFPAISDTIINLVSGIFKECNGSYKSMDDIPDKILSQHIILNNYQPNWKPETRIKVLKEKGSEYYSLLHLCEDGNKTIINTETYNDVTNTVNVLKSSVTTSFWFKNIDEDYEERCYQLKFKATFKDVDYRCMADLIYVNHDEKYIIPIDLKTSSKPEYDFYKSFVDWNYAIQARLYWRIIRDNLNKDPYFKDFELLPYRFIVVNKNTLNPLIWEFEDTTSEGDIQYKDVIFRDPFVIGDELNRYLLLKPEMPFGMQKLGSNSLKNWLNK